MSAIDHLQRGNTGNKDGRADKLETDRYNSIVERISGVNPSKLAAEVTKEHVETFTESSPSAPRRQPQIPYGSGPAFDLGGAKNDHRVDYLADKVAQLERKLAKFEDIEDNDVVMGNTLPAKGPSNRGADSMAFGRDINKKQLKAKDPGKIKTAKKLPGGQMAAEHLNILGISMSEWREQTGLPSPAVDLTIPKAGMSEEFEDEIEDEAPVFEDAADNSTDEYKLWASFLENYDTTPEDLAAFAEAAEEHGDAEVLVAIQDLEDEFVESIGLFGDGMGKKWSQWLEARGLSVATFDSLVENASDEDFEMLSQLQAMFEAEIAGKRIAGGNVGPGEAELNEPGKPKQTLQSLAHGQIKPSRKGNFTRLPKRESVDDSADEGFDVDADESGHPDMKHPGWAKAMKKFKLDRKPSSKKSR